MGLEVTTTIEGLDVSNPASGDDVDEGDNHLRLIKIVLKNILPGLGGNGFSIPVVATEADLNHSTGLSGNIQAQIDAAVANIAANTIGVMPVGGIAMYNGLISAIPVNWQLCDGTNGTPNLIDNFVMGTVTQGEILTTGGAADAVVIAHDHTMQGAGDHDHGGAAYNSAQAGANGFLAGATTIYATLPGSGNHTHIINSEGVIGTDLNLPPFVKLAYIQRLS